MSQIVGTQAVLNVLSGRRWHVVRDEMKAYLRGKYGAAPGPVSREVIQSVLGDENPSTCGRPIWCTRPLEDYRDDIGELARSEEDLLSYALFPRRRARILERHRIGPESDVFGTQIPAYLTSQAGAALGETPAIACATSWPWSTTATSTKSSSSRATSR